MCLTYDTFDFGPQTPYLLSFCVTYVFQGTYKVQADLRDKASNKRISCVEAVVTITS